MPLTTTETMGWKATKELKKITQPYNEEKDIRTTVVKITTENGARAMGRPQGTYITIESEGLSAPDEDYHREVSEELSRHFHAALTTL